MLSTQEQSSVDTASEQVEAVLRDHPFVASTSVIDEGPDGHAYSVAYVVPSLAWQQGAQSPTFTADQGKRITNWQRIFDRTYREPTDGTPNFVGWTSNYTNRPLPENEMQEWLDTTVARIVSLRPERVLEIGCGVGLLVETLAPRCRSYHGTDFSAVAINRLHTFTTARSQLRHVELSHRAATDFAGCISGSVDTVVVNSVIQYFPNLDYLRSVMEGAAQVVAPGGRIFVGDVRHFGLLWAFHSSVQLAKAPPEATVGSLKRRIALAIEQEKELVIDPRFFLEFAHAHPRITNAEILVKRGCANNELTRYRYDVVLHIEGKKGGIVPVEVDWNAGDHSFGDLVACLGQDGLSAIRVCAVRNSRMARDLAGLRLLEKAEAHQRVEALKARLDTLESVGVDPEAVWRLADLGTHDVRIEWGAGSVDGSFDVTLSERDQTPNATLFQHCPAEPANLASFLPATDPMAVALRNQLGFELGQFLQSRLPASRLPSAVIVLSDNPPPPLGSLMR